MFNKASYQNKLYSIYSLFIFIIMTILLLVFYTYISQVITSNSKETMKQVIGKTSSQLDSIVKSMDALSMQVLSSKDIQDKMFEIQDWQEPFNYFYSNPESTSKIRFILSSINSPLVTAGRVGIFNLNGCFISTGKFGEAPYALKNNLIEYTFLSKLDSMDDKKILLAPHKDKWLDVEPIPLVISLIRQITAFYIDSSQKVGYIEIDQNYTMIEDILNKSIPDKFNVIVYDSDGNLIYPLHKYNSKEINYYTSLKEVNGAILKRSWDNTEEFVYSSSSSYSKWTVVLTQQKEHFMAPIYFLRNIIILVGIIFLFITLIIFYLITRSLTAPVREMRKMLKGLSLDNLSIDLGNQTYNNEITLLNEAFNKTFIRLRESIDQTLQARASEAHAHILAYQAQMNPHFLFNTLMAINGAAQEVGSDKIILMCQQLSNMLRYTASFKEERIMLENELTHTSNYLQLMKIRYEDFLEYDMEVPQDLLSITVPKLIIQPLVENCFSHGFGSATPPFKILIKGFVNDGKWIIHVSDNGCGFDENSIQNIFIMLKQYENNSLTGDILSKSEIGGMGLINIFMRLKLKYGNESIFNIENNSTGGAKIIIGGLIQSE